MIGWKSYLLGQNIPRGDLFNSPEGYNPFASVGDMYINVGYSTGQAITGYLNSSIQCGVTDPMNPSASVIDKFAQSVGKTDYMDIVCNGESAGIMKQQYWDGSNWVDSVGQCRTRRLLAHNIAMSGMMNVRLIVI